MLDKYFEHNKDKDLFPILFESLINKGYAETLEAIAKIDIDFDPLNFDEELFQEKYINAYGIRVLLKLQNRIDINLLDSGLRDFEIKEKIVYFANETIFDKISRNHIYNDNFSITFFDAIKKIFNRFELSCFIKMMSSIKDYEIDEIKLILENQELLFKFRFLLTRISEFSFYIIQSNKEEFYSNEMTIFVKTFIKHKINTSDNHFAIFTLFKQYRFLFINNDIINSKTIKAFLEDQNRDKYGINNIDDLNNFFELRNKYYLENPSNEMFLSIFGLSKEKLLEKIKKYIKANKELKFLSIDEIKLLSDLDYLKNNPEFLAKIELRYRTYCKKEITSSLFIPKHNSDIIDLSLTPFRTIAHKIRFASGKAIGKKLTTDLSLWDSNYIDSSYISGTLIDDYSLGMIDSSEYTLCFSNIDSEDILDMGLIDIFASIYLYYNGLPNKLSDFFTTTDFEHSTASFYNEVVLKRFNGSILRPDLILGFDHINSFMKEAKNYFNISIGLIDSSKSASKMNEHNMSLLEKNMIIQYGIFVYKFYASYRYKYDIIKKYFSNSNDILNNLINNYLITKDENTKKSLLFLIDIFAKINQDLETTGLLECKVDTESFRKKLII